MHVLAIDTSSAAVTAALADVGEHGVTLRASRATINARGHGELLAPSIAGCLREAGAVPGDLGAIVAGLGPGPFTGLRVGLVTAAVMADTLGIPAYGVCSLDAIAGAVDAPDLLVAGDARRKEIYWARYVDGERVAGPNVDRPADVATDAAAMAGAGARAYADVLGLPLVGPDHPDPRALVCAAAPRVRAAAPGEALAPLYLRRPDAVANATSKAVTP